MLRHHMRYDELSGLLTAALGHIEKLGLTENVKKSRFTNYKALIERLCAIIKGNSFEKLPPEIKQELTDRNLEYVLSLTESVTLVETMDYLKACEDPEIVREKLARILSGPVLPKDEDHNSNEARN